MLTPTRLTASWRTNVALSSYWNLSVLNTGCATAWAGGRLSASHVIFYTDFDISMAAGLRAVRWPLTLKANSLTTSLTPRSTAVIEKLTVPQLAKKFPAFYGVSNVHYRISNSPPLIPVLNHINPPHALPFNFLKIHFNIIPLSTSNSSERALCFWFLHRNPSDNSLLCRSCHMSRLSYSLLSLIFFPPSCHFLPDRTPVLQHPQPMVSL